MLRRVYSSLSSFKELTFNKHLNILVAVKTDNSTDKHTRNRAGKSSLVQLIHFVFGSSCKPDNLFRKQEILSHEFGCDFDLKGEVISIARNGAKPSKLKIYSGEGNEWVVPPRIEKKTGDKLITNTNWKEVLGEALFNIESIDDDGENNVSFRSLFSYFARRQEEGGFEYPFKYFSGQYPASIQTCFFYFFGLDLALPSKWQRVREREKTIKELKKASGSGLFKDVIESTSNLRTEIAISESKIEKAKEDINNYNVLPEYSQIEQDASKYVSELNELANNDTIDNQLLIDLEASLEELPEVNIKAIQKVYNEAGVLFPDVATRKLEEVIAFHESVHSNRQAYLNSEITAIRNRAEERLKKKTTLQEKYSESMKLLSSHGALEPYVKLQEKLDRLTIDLESQRDKFDVAQSLETNKTLLENERNELMNQLINEYNEQSSLISETIVLFESISSRLYEEAGSLHIGESLNGPTFDIKIQGEKSKGINNMQIFCLDFTLMLLSQKYGYGPGFLIHDSHIFDGVDERQIFKAIELGQEIASQNNFQYIITLNSDVYEGLSNLSTPEFNISDFVLPQTLTDETDSGGLFGIRF